MALHKPTVDWAQRCPIRDVIDRTSDRWTVLVLTELETGTLRFSALKVRIEDISQRMLAQTLRQLEYNGLVSRRVYPTVPPKVEYSLTELGHSFMVPVRAMIAWAENNHPAVRAARERYQPPQPNIAK